MEKRQAREQKARQGIGHVEVILAFLLFVSAVLFIFSFVEFRGGTSERHDATLAYLTNYVTTNMSVPVEIYSVVLNKTELDKKAQPPLLLTIELPENIRSEQRLRVEDTQGKRLPAGKDSSNARQIVVNRASAGTLFFHVLLSEGITKEEDSLVPPPHQKILYQVASRTSFVMLAESKLSAFAERYRGEYELLRDELGLQQTHFGLSVGLQGKDFINAQNSIPARADVRAQNIRQSVLRADGTRAFADVVVKAW